MKFYDASAVIPLCVEEPHSGIVRGIAKKDNAIAVWWGTHTECCSAFARLLRDGALDPDGEDQARGILYALSSAWAEIEPSEDIREASGRLLLSHNLRAADSLQLAAAIIWADKRPRGQYFVCLDQRLREAARKEGFIVLPAKPGG